MAGRKTRVPGNGAGVDPAEPSSPVAEPQPPSSGASGPDVQPSPETKPSAFNQVWSTKDPYGPRDAIRVEVQAVITDSGLADKYEFVFLYDEHDSITRYTVDQIYSALPSEKKDVLLIVHSHGGNVEPAYLVSKCCKAKAKKFCVAIPRLAKSAATLISLGADEIHMGLVSELGPIDPQVGKYPALALRSALEHLTGLVEKHPEASGMYSSYLASQLDLRDLGYLERVSESAVQYAERLLAKKQLGSDHNPAQVAHRLVYEYKDHRFVIDRDEARSILGDKIVRFDSPEYQVASAIHRLLAPIDLAYSFVHKKKFKVIGDLGGGIHLWDVEE